MYQRFMRWQVGHCAGQARLLIMGCPWYGMIKVILVEEKAVRHFGPRRNWSREVLALIWITADKASVQLRCNMMKNSLMMLLQFSVYDKWTPLL